MVCIQFMYSLLQNLLHPAIIDHHHQPSNALLLLASATVVIDQLTAPLGMSCSVSQPVAFVQTEISVVEYLDHCVEHGCMRKWMNA